MPPSERSSIIPDEARMVFTGPGVCPECGIYGDPLSGICPECGGEINAEI